MRTISLLIAFAVASLVEATPSSLPYFTPHDFTPVFEVEGDALAQVNKFAFTDQSGQPVTHTHLEGKITVVNFFFTKCNGICPMLMSNLRSTHDQLKNMSNVQFLSFSITPEHDTPAKLREFAKSRGIATDHWKLITGEHQSLLKFAKENFKADKKTGGKNPDQFVHSDTVFLVDGNSYIRGIYNGQRLGSLRLLVEDAQQLATSIKLTSSDTSR